MAKYKVEYADAFDKAMKKLSFIGSISILNSVDFPTSPGEEFEGKFFQDMFDFEVEIIESLLKSITISCDYEYDSRSQIRSL